MTASVDTLKRRLDDAVRGHSWNLAAVQAKKLALAYEERRQYDLASRYYDETARYWAKFGQPSWGIANSIRADHLRTVLETYAEVPVPSIAGRKLEKHEPLAGAYAGLFPAGKGFSGSPSGAEKAFGRKHALYLTYTHFYRYYPEGTAFPVRYAEEVKKLGGALQIGWEPHGGLGEVSDGKYVRQFAREAAASGIPVFLRFACEMNGPWVAWHGDPQLYVEKFRLIHDIMEKEAPNVAMVWSPNFLPRDNIDPYYPGDAYVHWVGVSLYTIPFSHGELKLGGNPIDYLRPLYEKYARKPMMVSEGAVSFHSYQLGQDFTDWGVGQLANMYAYMPRMFPMLKAITYFDLDKRTTDYDNRNNNYDLHDRPAMLQAYLRHLSDPYFLDRVKEGAAPARPVTYRPLAETRTGAGPIRLFTYVKLPLGERPLAVELYDGTRLIGRSETPPFDMEIGKGVLSSGGKLTVKVLDREGKVRAVRNYALR